MIRLVAMGHHWTTFYEKNRLSLNHRHLIVRMQSVRLVLNVDTITQDERTADKLPHQEAVS